MQLDTAACERYISDYVTSGLSRLRDHADISSAFSDTNPDGLLHSAPLYCDSLEIAVLAGMLNDIFCINQSGLEDLLLAKPGILSWSRLLAKSLSHYSKTVSFFSSGSSGDPEKHVHKSVLLIEEVKEIWSLILKGGERVVSLVPSHHIYGFLFSIILPYIAEIPGERQHGAFTEFAAGDVVIAIPTWIRQWRLQNKQLPENIQVLSSTSALPKVDAEWLMNGGAKYLEIFGSSETSGLGWRAHPENPFSLFTYWQHADTGLIRSGLERAVELPDALEWTDSRHFMPHGRKDKAIQISGKNVFPSHIESRYVILPEVAAASVREFDSIGGPRLKIFIVPSHSGHCFPADNAALEQKLRSWAIRSLDSVERPASYNFGSALPENSMGKRRDF